MPTVIRQLSTKAFWCQNNPREAAEEIERLRAALKHVSAALEREYMGLPATCHPGPPRALLAAIDAALSP